jgi:NAD(P)-dependent dehydrogenase (short-subunit alcohol dehydrogenase family)
MAKAAQRNMTQSLAKVYGPKGVHIGMVLVGGPVDPAHITLSPSNIASRTWGLFEEPKEKQTFEIQVV